MKRLDLRAGRTALEVARKFVMMILAAAMFLLPAGAASAQAGGKLPRVGVIGEHGPDDPRMVAFRQHMRVLGYTEVQNIVLDYRYLHGALDRVPGLISELLGRNVERISVLYNPVNPVGALAVDRIREVARALAVQVKVLEVHQPKELHNAFAKLSTWRAGAVLVVSDPMLGNELVQLATLASTHRVPAIYNRAEFARAGGLLAFGPNYSDNYRRAASFVDRIVKGAKPQDLPVEQPTTFEFLINLRTARALGVMIPQALLLRADEVIQ